ncbi:MAG: hypothetical protein ACE5EL_00765 [Anaerolineae bacterium]
MNQHSSLRPTTILALALVAMGASLALAGPGVAYAEGGPTAPMAPGVPAVDDFLTADLAEGVELALTDTGPGSPTTADVEAADDLASDAAPEGAAPNGPGPGIAVTKGCGSTYAPGEIIEARIRPHYTGWHSFSLAHGSSSRGLGSAFLYGNYTYTLRFRVFAPLGSYELQMTVPNVLILYRCQFQVGQSSSAPSGSVVIEATYTANDYLQAQGCFAPGRRVYFAARVKNQTGQTQQVAIRIMSRGALSNWWPHKIEVLSLAPGESRLVLAFDDHLPVAGYQLQADLFGRTSAGWTPIATATGTFKVGSCP